MFGLLLSRSREVADLASSIFGSFVAVTGDAHQAKVAQDIFRQQVRYERSIQIREDMRDVNKLMMESVQTHVIMGSIILGVCWNMCIEGFPPEETERAVVGLWLVFTCWSVTYTLIALWLALRFQMKMSSSARDRLLRRHRLMVPDDLVVGRMGGHNVVNQVANFHSWMLTAINNLTSTDAAVEDDSAIRVRGRRHLGLRVQVEPREGSVDVEPLRKGMHAWLHPEGDGWSHHTLLDIPFFLTGETLIRSPWQFNGERPLAFRVYGEATLYVAAQCPPLRTQNKQRNEPSTSSTNNHGLKKALWLAGQVPDWPADELPLATQGFHEDWAGESGCGEFRRVEGFSMYVDRNDIEMPVYKLVLANPSYGNYVDVVVNWNFKAGCEALVVVVRKGQVHCKEEDWPLAEFNAEVKEVLNLRHYSGLYLRHGTSCLVLACCVLYLARMSVLLRGARFWWYESTLVAIAMLPSIVAIRIMPLDVWEKETVLSEVGRNPPQQKALDEVNVVSPQPTPVNVQHVESEPRLLLSRPGLNEDGGDLPSVFAVSPQSASPGVLQGPARMLLQREAEQVAQSEVAQRSTAATRSQSAPARTREVPSFGLRGCCSEIQGRLENCQIVAHDSERHTIRNLRQQALPPPQPRSDAGLPPEATPQNSPPSPPLQIETENLDSAKTDPFHLNVSFEPKAKPPSSPKRRCFRRCRWQVPKTGQNLFMGTLLLEALLSLSCLSTLITLPWASWSQTSSLEWIPLPISWPALFRPTAVLHSNVLRMAAGPVLRSFSAGSLSWGPAGTPVLLPHHTRGLGVWADVYVILGQSGLYLVEETAVAPQLQTAETGLDALELLDLPGSVNGSYLAYPARVQSAIAGTVASISGSSTVAAVLLATSDELYLCRMTNSTGSFSLAFVSNLKPVGEALSQITGLYMCPQGQCASQAVLWISMSQGRLAAIGFASGKVLTVFPASSSFAASTSTLLTGNSTHLILVAVSEGTLPTAFSVPYPPLPEV